MFNKQLFILAHQIGDRSFYPTYQLLVKNQWRPYAELKENQEKQLRHMISFVYENVPYYRNLFKGLKLFPRDIQTIEDLQKLPILTKGIIKQHWEDFKPANLSSLQYYDQATGGSTGTPLQYRLSKQDRFLGGALLYRGWGYGGYQLGDRMAFLAGSSLDVGTKSYLTKKTHEIARNIRKLSSFDMGEKEMRYYTEILNTFKPRFIRGYASSIYFYAQWLEKNDAAVSFPDAVFTTAEKLFPPMRETIGRVFDCQVFDEYGLNDGGISAYECPEHSGLHIDTERSIMEVADSGGFQMNGGQGQILATSLHNYAMPFLRYSTGDEGLLLEDSCSCGRGPRLLKEILGREQSMLITPEGKYIHGEYFTHIFWEIPHVKEFQVVQKTIDEIQIIIVQEQGFNEEKLERIKQIIASKSPNWKIKFQFVDEIQRTGAGKYKFIINEMLNA
jgi:phenylacetate-CoA ligase